MLETGTFPYVQVIDGWLFIQFYYLTNLALLFMVYAELLFTVAFKGPVIGCIAMTSPILHTLEEYI